MAKFTADQLEEIISALDTLYEQGLPCRNPINGEIVSDSEYDDYKDLLSELRPDSSILKGASASTVAPAKTIKHDPPLTSISKANHEDRNIQKKKFLDWIQRIERLSGKKNIELVKTYKFDGIALGLYYELGKLACAGLRSKDGTTGEDVTEQVKYVPSIPKILNKPLTCSIRGELICLLSDFEKVQQYLRDIGEKIRANARNHTAGAIRQTKDLSKVEKMRLSFIGYSIEGLDGHFKNEIERAAFANELGVDFCDPQLYRDLDQLESMEEKASMLDFEVDGIVVSVNDLALQKSLGHSGDNPTNPPNGKIAWKFREEAKAVVIKNITWQIGRTGRVTPVASFDPVRLAGTQVSRVTLHNYGLMRRLGIGVGTEVQVCKSGKIIPKVIDVISGQYSDDPPYPAECPETGVKFKLVEREDGIAELVAEESNDSSKVLDLYYFLNTLQIKGVGKAAVEKLVDAGVVNSRVDFFRLHQQDLIDAGFSKRQSWKALASLNFLDHNQETSDIAKGLLSGAITEDNPKEITVWKFIASLGIPQVSESTAKSIFSKFEKIEDLFDATVSEILECDDVGEKTAIALTDWLRQNRTEVQALLRFFKLSYGGSGPLSGKTFVLTGGFPGGKQTWQSKIESQGGRCASSIGRKVDYCVAGSNAGSKLQKANQLGVSVVSVDDLAKLLGE